MVSALVAKAWSSSCHNWLVFTKSQFFHLHAFSQKLCPQGFILSINDRLIRRNREQDVKKNAFPFTMATPRESKRAEAGSKRLSGSGGLDDFQTWKQDWAWSFWLCFWRFKANAQPVHLLVHHLSLLATLVGQRPLLFPFPSWQTDLDIRLSKRAQASGSNSHLRLGMVRWDHKISSSAAKRLSEFCL